jgi:hypothetical protein
MIKKIRPRSGSAFDWTLKNPTLAYKEMGLETDTGRFKLGDGVTQWQSLGYFDDIKPRNNKEYTVSTVPSAGEWGGATIYVSDETGGGTLAFSDGTNWRRVQDRAIIS